MWTPSERESEDDDTVEERETEAAHAGGTLTPRAAPTSQRTVSNV